MIDDLGGEFGLADRLAAVEAGLTCADGHRLGGRTPHDRDHEAAHDEET
jgi:hypothetical protein